MKLPVLFPFWKKEKINYFLALLLRDESVNAVIFEEIGGKVKVIGKHEERFKETIDETSLDDLLDLLDKTISAAESTLPLNVETQKTVFGLKENWVIEAKIKKEYLLKLKKISEELDLQPIGFLVIHEAITHLLQKEEGAPISAILVEIGNKNINVSVIKGGKIVDTKRKAIEESISKTTDQILHHFTDCEILPSKIFVFNNENDEKLQQEFISHSWSKSLPFLHLPQITTLPKGYDAKSVLFGAASQMGFEVPMENIEEKISSSKTESNHEKVNHPRYHIEEKEVEENFSSLEEETSLESFGFVKEKDIVEKGLSQKLNIKKHIVDEQTKISDQPEDVLKQLVNIKDQNIIEENVSVPEVKRAYPSNQSFSFFKRIIPNHFFLKNINVPKLPNFSFLKTKKKMFFVFSFVFILIIGLIFLYIFNLKATITLIVSSKTVERTQDVTFSTDRSSDFSKNIIRSELVSVSKDGSLSTPTKGKKEIGDKAKGTITLYGRFTEEKTFPTGTVITSSNDLQFTLDSVIKLASTSADASAAPSSGKVAVTAKNIGKESNLPSGTKFTVSSYPTTTVIGKNDVAFSGGTKKEVVVVSKADLDKLTVDFPKKLQENIENDLIKKISSDKSLLPILVDSELTKKEFNQKIGDEAETVTIKGTVIYKGAAYEKNNLENFSKNLLQNNIQNMVVSEKGIEYEIKDVTSKNDKEIFAKILIKTYLLPKIDTQKLSQELKSKSFKDAKNLLSKTPNFSDVEFKLKPTFPLLPELLPYFSKNINFIIKSND